MKKEGKTIRNLIVGILVLMMTMALMAGCTEEPADTTPSEPTKPVVLNYDVYYNKTHLTALTVDPDDQTFHMTLWNKGKSVTVRCDKIETAEKVMAATTMLLVKNEKGIVTDIQAIDEVSAKFVGAYSYVTKVDGNKISLSSGPNAAGWDLGTIELDASTVMTDTTGGSAVGAMVKLRVNDCIYAIANAEGKVTHVFIAARTAEQRLAYCEHCDKEVTWTAHMLDDKGTLPTAVGHWYLTSDGTVKATTTTASGDVVLDLNGHTVNTSPSLQCYILNGAKTYVHLMDQSKAQTGKIVATMDSSITAAGGIIDVGKAGAKFVMYSGTIDASKIVSTQTGAAVYVVKGCFFEMHGGKIIGGTVQGNIGSTGSDAGGRGGALNLAAGSSTKITGGEIVGGKAVLLDKTSARAHGGAVYLYAGAEFEMTGGKISGGEAELGGPCVYVEKESDLVNNGGTIENIEVKK